MPRRVLRLSCCYHSFFGQNCKATVGYIIVHTSCDTLYFYVLYFKNPAHPFCTHCSKITTETGNCCTGWCDTQKGQNPIRPSAPKIVRLAFHDCLKYEDGTGGCDGCLGWQGMGVTYRTKVSSTAPKYLRLLSLFQQVFR